MNVIAKMTNWLKSHRRWQEYNKSVSMEKEDEVYDSIEQARKAMRKLRETLVDLYGYNSNSN